MFATAAAAVATTFDSGDTAWMLTSTALVLFMTLPGLALFYGGMVRAKNLLSVLMQCFAITGAISVAWVVYGYSLAFGTSGMEEGVVNLHSFVGDFGNVMLANLAKEAAVAEFPESVFVTFQMTFAIITPALIVGAFAERMRFAAMLVFSLLWFTVVYTPIAHMVWAGPGGLMWDWGVLDFAGGTVVHINAGIAGLVAAVVLGKRKGYPTTPMPPHNLGYTLTGAAMLWVGWFGFNAGSAAAADETAGMAMLVTQVATAAAALAWMAVEWIRHGKPSALGIASGVVAGLVAITPAAGTVGPGGALAIGAASGVVCFFFATAVKRRLGYDDALDVFGVHAIGGIVGAILTGVFAAPALGGFGEVTDIGAQVIAQAGSVGFTIAYTAVLSWLLLKLIGLVIPLRVDEEQEAVGLDLALHDERGYNL
ncbi:ammonium transporter [Arenimonas composti TR7-09 = DSM 18010]|uniref:Ammonium transporter n=2 Tax=Arenimonas TaxID=490567 RepID=A0A091BCW6_9GAMM|nr:ammonium transporter [Arenimonas composti TR7-09 = DSM 18010]